MRRVCGSLLLVIALVAAGCGGDDEDSDGTATAPVTAAAAPECEAATSDVMTPIGNKLMPEEVRASAGHYVRLKDEYLAG